MEADEGSLLTTADCNSTSQRNLGEPFSDITKDKRAYACSLSANSPACPPACVPAYTSPVDDILIRPALVTCGSWFGTEFWVCNSSRITQSP